jgi:hypothetical protein
MFVCGSIICQVKLSYLHVGADEFVLTNYLFEDGAFEACSFDIKNLDVSALWFNRH